MDLQAIKALKFDTIVHAYTAKDTLLYALGLGFGSDPMDATELAFVYEEGQKVVPSICCVLAHPGFWAKRPELGVNWVKILHGEQSFEIHKPFAPAATVRGEYEIEAVEDKGPEKGAVLHLLKRLRDESNELIATVRSVLMLRGDGGFGSFGAPPEFPGRIPDGEPERSLQIKTLPQQALVYRLSGDYNPIHADPVAAKKAGFDRPILHGLCTMGVATRALIHTYAPDEPERLKYLFVRFSKPVFPGETIETHFFKQGTDIRFRCQSSDRGLVVLDNGLAIFS